MLYYIPLFYHNLFLDLNLLALRKLFQYLPYAKKLTKMSSEKLYGILIKGNEQSPKSYFIPFFVQIFLLALYDFSVVGIFTYSNIVNQPHVKNLSPLRKLYILSKRNFCSKTSRTLGVLRYGLGLNKHVGTDWAVKWVHISSYFGHSYKKKYVYQPNCFKKIIFVARIWN